MRTGRSREYPRRHGQHAPKRLLPPQRRAELSGGRDRHSPAGRHRRRQHDVGLGLSAQRPQSRKILAQILEGVPDDEQAKIAGGNTARVYNFDAARLTVPA